jgi:hypothetical protein
MGQACWTVDLCLTVDPLILDVKQQTHGGLVVITMFQTWPASI